MTALADQGMLDLGPEKLEYRMIGPRPDAAPTIVMLHEGLGCVGMWGDFPDKVAAATGCGVFVYSRKGYGKSQPGKAAASRSATCTRKRRTRCRGCSTRSDFSAAFCSDTATARRSRRSMPARIRIIACAGLVLMAPHFIVEEMSVKSIAEAREAYNKGDLRARSPNIIPMSMSRSAAGTMSGSKTIFGEWDISEELAYIRVPILIVQGEDDQYGTARQIEIAKEECYCPVEVALLPGVKHQPHREGAEVTLKLVADFTGRVLQEQEQAVASAV